MSSYEKIKDDMYVLVCELLNFLCLKNSIFQLLT